MAHRLFIFIVFIAFNLSCDQKNAPIIFSYDQTTPDKSYNPNIIYGIDNRKDLFEVNDPQILQWADATAGMVFKNKFSQNSDGTFNIRTLPYGESYKLCSDEKFYDQKIATSCSAFLVQPDIILTAGHCVRTQIKCNKVSFVFGLSINHPLQIDSFSRVPKSEIYNCQKIIKQQENGNGADFAIIQLDRTVKDHTPLKLRLSGEVDIGTELTIIGHPLGLPTKVSNEAMVSHNERKYFISNLDSFSGNSGAAVFNDNTGQVEGILVRGAHDHFYDKENRCLRTNVCEKVDPQMDECKGEHVSKIKFVLPYLPHTP